MRGFLSKCKTPLAALGILITIVGFYLDHYQYFPAIQRLLTPKYMSALDGYKSLKTNQPLVSRDRGFVELQRIFRDEIYLGNKEGNPLDRDYEIVRIEFGGSQLMASPSASGPVEEFIITADVAKPITIMEWSLATKIDNYYGKNVLFSWTLWVFWIGILITIVSISLLPNRGSSVKLNGVGSRSNIP